MKTHCKRGHEFTIDNTRIDPNSKVRICRACVAGRGRIKRAIDKVEGKLYPSHTPEAKKRGHLKELGWTLESFYLCLEKQSHRCAICGKILNLYKKQNGSRACADHEHIVPPRPRGIICTNCNAGIGQFQDNPKICEAAAMYLKSFANKLAEEVK